MIQIKIKDKQLEIDRSMSLSIEYQSPIWMGDDVNAVPGDVVIPFDVPLSRYNNSIFGFVDSLGNRKRVRKLKDATLLVDGNEHLHGTFEIEKIAGNAANAKIYGGVGALQDFKTKYINDSSLYAVNDFYFDNILDAILKMNASLSSVFDYVVIPFRDTLGTDYNNWDLDNQTYTSANDFIPFFRVTKILNQLVEGQNWRLIWKDISDYEDWLMVCNRFESGNFKKTDVLPKILASEFIKSIALHTGNVIFADVTTKTILFKKYDDLKKGSSEDWTEKVLSTESIEFASGNFDKEFDSYVYEYEDEVWSESVSGGQIDYTQNRIVIGDYFGSDKDNLEKLIFLKYNGLESADIYTANSGNYSNAKTLNYGKGGSVLEDIYAHYTTWIKLLNRTKLVTFRTSLTYEDVRKHRFSKKIRILNAKDGHYYTFLVKSIKEQVNTRQRGEVTIECLLID